MAGQRSLVVDLTPPSATLCLYEGHTSYLELYDEENDAPVALTGWALAGAEMRPSKTSATVVDLLPTFDGTIVSIAITPAMITALGTDRGVWEVDMTDDQGNPSTFWHGSVQVERQVRP